jgi:hypothetical protein
MTIFIALICVPIIGVVATYISARLRYRRRIYERVIEVMR